MALGIRTKHPFRDDEIVVCVSGFATEHDVVAGGQELRGGHRLVRAHPDMFALKGDPEALAVGRAKVFDAGIAAAQATAEAHQASRVPPWQKIPVEDRLVVLYEFGFGALGMTQESHSVGAIVDRREPKIAKVVEEHPSWFAVQLDWIPRPT